MKAAVAFGLALMVVPASACQPVLPPAGPYRQASAAANSSLLGTWELVSVDGLAIRPKAVSVTFDSKGAFTAMVDCNTARGYYSLTGTQLSFVGWTATERGCEGSLEHQALIEKALLGDGYRVAFRSSSELQLSGPHEVTLRRI